ncbi:hypothetical protein [Luteimicrobium subarcticum]|uniref:Uncharacterized protein n=1 Tax=Luteimicrobium subarcticum TaxID=620910 RepID=A0A2M8WVL4_9MICO|nr:hypothetical protein [Luteimicrobium subarcticum]PJI94960.1 hypothetical protein CLV34_0812 [Luteimicrobium subarcticum]
MSDIDDRAPDLEHGLAVTAFAVGGGAQQVTSGPNAGAVGPTVVFVRAEGLAYRDAVQGASGPAVTAELLLRPEQVVALRDALDAALASLDEIGDRPA